MEEERIGLFIDYENLAIGAREDLGIQFDFKPVADALAERGRVVVRRAYADWTFFDKDRRMLTDNQIELIEIPQRRGAVRKNAADIKMAVDAVELAFERDYITMFVLCTGDSDFTPLVHKLREQLRDTPHTWLECRTSPYTQSSALHPVAEMIEGAFDVSDDTAASAALCDLVAALRQRPGIQHVREGSTASPGGPDAVRSESRALDAAVWSGGAVARRPER